MRSGGEADKLGNHYEGAWIVSQLLDVLAGRAESVTVEELGEIGKGAEFTLRRTTVTEVHQVKRQRGSANYWMLGDLRDEGVLEAARRHVAAGREFHFVSTIPAQALQALAFPGYMPPFRRHGKPCVGRGRIGQGNGISATATPLWLDF
jgi:hypothetical protein